MSQARDWYEKTRNLSAFNVGGYVRKQRNQHATVYVFDDQSRFIVYSDFSKAYRQPNGYIMAKRND